ncbi:Hsp20/alpha crystallin family protein [bacterium]|nr:Hsp20/alpha crystallin family protein [bacterium]
MAIKKWTDDENLFGRLHRLEKIFNDFFGEENFFTISPAMQSNWAPNIDIKENKTNYNVIAEFPGLTKDDIEISLERNVLTIKGEKKMEKKMEKNEKEENYLHIERSYGSFFRSFRFPEYIESEKVKASFKNGLLKLEIPKKKGTKGKKIEIHSE